MKICILNTLFLPFVYGGAEKSVSLLAKALARQGHHVTVITLHPEAYETRADWNGVTVHYLPHDNVYWPFSDTPQSAWQKLRWHLNDIWNTKAAQRVGGLLDALKPDVLHTNMVNGFSVAVWWEARKRGIRIVHTLREYALLCSRGTLFRKGRTCQQRCAECTFFSLAKGWASGMVDAVVGLSRATLGLHKKFGFFPHAQEDIIFNIADVAIAPPRPIKKNDQGLVCFGFMGRIESEKGVEVLLKATSLLPQNGWRLLLAGKGHAPYVKNLKDIYKNLPLEWLGFVAPDTVFENIHVLVVPSLWVEPLSRVVIEAAARGIPVIAADSGGPPELLALGLPGVVYPAYDHERLAEHMRAVIEGRENFSTPIPNAQEHWPAFFSEQTITAQYLKVYNGG